MDPATQETIERSSAASYAGTTSFGEVVATLTRHGVESYRVDYRLRSTSYYLPSGETHTLPLKAGAGTPGDAFDAEALQAAIRGSQRGEVKYPEFLERSMAAGCIGYVVWLAGRYVTYFGRRGEQHIERFPSQPT